ncbi:MAG: hypothetical protein ABGZ23_22220, partial [Fuerstiella sp.]
RAASAHQESWWFTVENETYAENVVSDRVIFRRLAASVRDSCVLHCFALLKWFGGPTIDSRIRQPD